MAALLRLGPRIIPQPEVDEIRMKIDDECSEGEGTWREVLSFGHQASGGRTLLGAGLQLFQQVTGINAIMFFAPELFARYFTAGGALYGALMVNALNHAATYATVFLVDRLGRVTLLVGSGSGMASCLMAAAALTRSGGSSTASNAAGYALIALSCGFVVSFAVGWGPVVWTVCAEMFPLRVRGKAISISTAVNWASATAVGLLFPLISSENALGISGTFAGFAACCLVGTVLVHLFLPETADVSLEDIDKAFERHRPNPFRKFWEKGSSLR